MFNKTIHLHGIFKICATIFAGLLCCTVKMYGQDASNDRKALLAEYAKVMSYKNKPFLHYESLSKDKANFLPDKNKDEVKNTFYRDKDIVYSRKGDKELYLRDGRLFSIDDLNQTISVVVADPDMITVLKPTCWADPIPDDPGGDIPDGGRNTAGQNTNRRSLDINRRFINDSVAQLNLEWYTVDSITTCRYTIDVSYNRKSLLPQYISKRMVTSPVKKKAALKAGNPMDMDKLELPGKKSDNVIISSAIYFQYITDQPDKKKFVSLFDEKISFDGKTNSVKGKGKCREYQIINPGK